MWIAALSPVLLYAAAIFAVSAQSDLPPSPVSDKVAHFIEYAALGFLLARALYLLVDRSVFWAAGVAVAAAVLFAGTDELHQYFVPNRNASVFDLLADFLGSVVGAGIYAQLARELATRHTTSA